MTAVTCHSPILSLLSMLGGVLIMLHLAGPLADLEGHMGMSRGTQWRHSQHRVGDVLCVWWSSSAIRDFRYLLFHARPLVL